jgi:hypothetical protein
MESMPVITSCEMELVPVLMNNLTDTFMSYVTRSNEIIDKEGLPIDVTDQKFDHQAGWFRAHGALLSLIKKFNESKKEYNEKHFAIWENNIEIQFVPRLLIPFIRWEVIKNKSGSVIGSKLVYNYASVMEKIITDELSRPEDLTLPVLEQLAKEREIKANLLSRLAKLKEANEIFTNANSPRVD